MLKKTKRRSLHVRRRVHRMGPSMYQLTILADALASTKPEDIDQLRRVCRIMATDDHLWELVKQIQRHEINRKEDIEEMRALFAVLEKGGKQPTRLTRKNPNPQKASQ